MVKDKLKMKPTLKEKRHYLVVKIKSNEQIDEKKAVEIIDKAILNFIGKLGYASAGPLYFKFLNTRISEYIIVVSILTKYVDYVKAALTLNSFNDGNIKLRCIGVSGTLEKGKRFLE